MAVSQTDNPEFPKEIKSRLFLNRSQWLHKTIFPMKFTMKKVMIALCALFLVTLFACQKEEFEPLCDIPIQEALDEYLTAFGPTGVQIAAYGFGGEPRARMATYVSEYVPNQLEVVWDIWVPLAHHADAADFPGTHTQQVICQYEINHYTGYAVRNGGQKRAAEVIVVESLTDRTKIPARAGGNCPDVAEQAIAIIRIDGEPEVRLEQFAREWNAGTTPQTCPDVSLTDGDRTYFYHLLF